MRRPTKALGAVALLSVALLAQAAQASKQRTEWNVPIAPFHIIGNIYFVGTAQLGSYLIVTKSGDILIDGALPESAQQIERNISTLGFHLHDVKYLLNTHAHYDHSGGLAELKRATGARMIASAGDAPNLRSGFTDSFGAGWDTHAPGVAVDRVIHDGEQVSIGSSVLTAHVMPGHTRGCTTWTMPVSEAGKSYNVLFYCSTSVPGYKLLHNTHYPQIVSDYERSFKYAATLPCDVFLANHTGFFHMQEKLARVKPGAPNPFVDPSEYGRYVRASYAEFESILAREHHGG